MKHTAATDPLWAGKRLKNARQQELDGARLGGQTRHAGDVEMGRLGAEEKVAVEEDGRLETAGGVEADRDAGGAGACRVGIHAEREHDIGVGGEPDRPERHRLERLLGNLPQHRGGEEPDLGALARLLDRRRQDRRRRR